MADSEAVGIPKTANGSAAVSAKKRKRDRQKEKRKQKRAAEATATADAQKKFHSDASDEWYNEDAPLLQVVRDRLGEAPFGFDAPTPVQRAVVPMLMRHRDVIAQACTGSGKTLSYVIPMVQMLLTQNNWVQGVRGVVLCPTRELAAQVFTVLCEFVRGSGILSAEGGEIKKLTLVQCTGKTETAVVAGDPIDSAKSIKKATATDGDTTTQTIRAMNCLHGSLVVATPGRLNTLLSAGKVVVKGLELLVLDEADRLLDMGFLETVMSIIEALPKQRRTGLFSATQVDSDFRDLIRVGMRNPTRVSVEVEGMGPTQTSSSSAGGEQLIPAELKNEYMIVPDSAAKIAVLIDFCRREGKAQKTIAYCLCCADVDYLAAVLPTLLADGSYIFPLHGKMEQKKRTDTLNRFRKARGGVLITTDVAARGLDLPDVEFVLQLDPPQIPEHYVHRIGRTARAGRNGRAMVLLRPCEDTYIAFMEKRRVPMDPCPLWEALAADPKVQEIYKGEKLKELSVKDRAVLEKAQRAFVSYVRGFREHRCSYIFEFRQLDIGYLARRYGLPQLPRMKEVAMLKKKGLMEGFEPDFSIDLDSIAYKDKTREKQRLSTLDAVKERKRAERKEREKAAAKMKAVKEHEAAMSRRDRKRRKREREEDDVGDLNDEYRALKKFERGQVTEAELDAVLLDEGTCENDKSEYEKFVKRAHNKANRKKKKDEKLLKRLRASVEKGKY